MGNILKAADRRIGLEKFEAYFKHANQLSVMKILAARRVLHSG